MIYRLAAKQQQRMMYQDEETISEVAQSKSILSSYLLNSFFNDLEQEIANC